MQVKSVQLNLKRLRDPYRWEFHQFLQAFKLFIPEFSEWTFPSLIWIEPSLQIGVSVKTKKKKKKKMTNGVDDPDETGTQSKLRKKSKD